MYLLKKILGIWKISIPLCREKTHHLDSRFTICNRPQPDCGIVAYAHPDRALQSTSRNLSWVIICPFSLATLFQYKACPIWWPSCAITDALLARRISGDNYSSSASNRVDLFGHQSFQKGTYACFWRVFTPFSTVVRCFPPTPCIINVFNLLKVIFPSEASCSALLVILFHFSCIDTFESPQRCFKMAHLAIVAIRSIYHVTRQPTGYVTRNYSFFNKK